MKTSKKGVIALDQPFNYNTLKEQLQPLSIFRKGEHVITEYEGKILAKSARSNRYGLLDFGPLVQDNLEQIEKIIQPVRYDLKINYGVQELKIYSDKFEYEGEIFQRMFVLFSSSNGTYPMRFDVGLFRQVCTNGLMLSTSIHKFETKHYSTAIKNNVQLLQKTLPDFDEKIDEQLHFVKELKKGEISLQKIYLELLKSKEDEPSKTAMERVKKFSTKLLSSPSDAIQAQLTERENRSLSHPLELAHNASTTKDFSIPKITAYNCYTEVFNRRLHAVNARENQRISEILLEC